MIEIVIDNRLRIRKGEIPAELLKSLRVEFEHSNPTFYKQKAMGFYTAEPRLLKTWRETETHDTFPRGGLKRLRQALEADGLDHDEVDKRTSGNDLGSFTGDWVTPKIIPEHRVSLWPHQQRIVDAIVEREQVLIRSGTGCITGDAMIGINRGGKGAQVRLDQLVHMHNGGVAGNRYWDKDIPTFVRARLKDGRVSLVRMRDAYESGTKLVYEIRFQSGHALRATADHRFLTDRGWRKLSDLSVSDEVYVAVSRRPVEKQGKKSKPQYLVQRVLHHPFATRKNIAKKSSSHTVPTHRLVAEARLNGLSYEQLVKRCNEGQIVFTELSRVVEIREIGMQQTYDIEMDEPHNFLANGIVVHNSGKTTALLGAISAAQVPTLVIVWDGGLLEQWQERIEKEMGIHRKMLGLIQGKNRRLKPLTLAMQQTLQGLSPEDLRALMSNFGMVAGDEIQRAAAKTYEYVFDSVTAKYKVGVSADERRKDGKDPLIYDQFGEVAVEIDSEEIIKAGFVVDVNIRMVPTQYDCAWYRELKEANAELDENEPKETPDFGKLLDEMTTNDERNRLIVDFIAQRIQEGRRMFVFTHRVAHAMLLDSLLTGLGVRSGRMLGGVENRREFNETKRALGKGAKDVGVGTYQAIGVGQDVPAVDAGFATTPIHSNKQAVGQIKGRMCRSADGKEHGSLYVAYDRLLHGAVPARAFNKLSKDTRVLLDDTGLWVPVNDYLKAWRVTDGETQRIDSADNPFQQASTIRSRQRG